MQTQNSSESAHFQHREEQAICLPFPKTSWEGLQQRQKLVMAPMAKELTLLGATARRERQGAR
jgi:hypothetical protein